MKNVYLIVVLWIFFLGCHSSENSNPHIIIHTNLGDIEAELFPKQAPKTVAGFLSFVDSGYYKNSSFYRVILQEGLTPELNAGIIQGGIWLTNDKQYPHPKCIEHENTKQTKLSHTTGTLSLARTSIGTANTEFFICIGDQTQFDYGNENNGDTEGFSAFGKIVKGMSIVRKIQQQRATGENFDKKIEITSIERSE